LFCIFHKWELIKVGMFPLGARYCKKCGTIEYGNIIYYNGSTYQKTFKKQKAIEFINERLNRIEGYMSNDINLNHMFEEQGVMYLPRYDLYCEYETPERFREILSELHTL